MKRLREGASFGSILGGGGAGGANSDRDLGFTDEQVHELATQEEDVDERMREIQRVAKSVEDLAVLFKELATLVVDQGTILDRIDVNMETAVVHVKKGLESIQDADKLQKNARPIKCMIVCVRGGAAGGRREPLRRLTGTNRAPRISAPRSLMVLIVIMTIIIIVRKS